MNIYVIQHADKMIKNTIKHDEGEVKYMCDNTKNMQLSSQNIENYNYMKEYLKNNQ